MTPESDSTVILANSLDGVDDALGDGRYTLPHLPHLPHWSLAQEYRSTQCNREPETLTGLDSAVNRLKGRWLRLGISKQLQRDSQAIAAQIQVLRGINQTQFLAQLGRARQGIRLGRNDIPTLAAAYAVVCLLAERYLQMTPYTVQVLGAVALHRGYAAQLLPGEGKTLTAALTACVAGWRGQPVHVITSNDYLARRDAQLMQPLYRAAGLSVADIDGELDDPRRQQAYRADVVYATSKELLADYLRDQMRRDGHADPSRQLIKRLTDLQPPAMQVMRGLATAIVDEADSVLVDDATTPLIISVPGENRLLKDASLAARDIVNRLHCNLHYHVDQRFHDVRLTEVGERFVESITQHLPPVWRGKSRRVDLLRQALLAKEMYRLDCQYIIQDQQVIIIDEKTGRAMPGRSWSYGLHQAVEAKENLPLTDPTETHAKLSFQRFFRRYQHLSGMSGTLQGIERELWQIYHLRCVIIPSRCINQRRVVRDRLFVSQQQKWQATLDEIIQLHKTQRPILVGTRSIVESQQLSSALQEQNIVHQVLNAHLLAEEAKIVAQAGALGNITIATNMAGRGTDILIDEVVAGLGGLHVIATERHESSRVDWQLFGRCGRQGQPGSAQALISLEDELFIKGLPKWAFYLLEKYFGMPWVDVSLRTLRVWLQWSAQTKAARIRGELLENEVGLEDVFGGMG